MKASTLSCGAEIVPDRVAGVEGSDALNINTVSDFMAFGSMLEFNRQIF